MKSIAPAALLFTLLTSTSFAADSPPEAKKFEGYTKSTRSRVHFEVNADATYTETVEYTVKALDKKGVDSINSQSISYSDALSDLQIVSAYTTKKSGKKIPVPKNNFQVQTNTGDNGNAPIISDIKTKTIVFPDVDEGDTVSLTYKLIQKEAMFPKQFSYSEGFPNNYISEDEEISLSAPESLPMRTEARGVQGGEVAKKKGKRQWLWKFENREIAKPESAAVSAFDFGPRVIMSTFKDYGELATAYESRARAKIVVSERVKKLAEEIAGKAKDKRETAAMLYEWVSKNIYYAGNCIGIGSVVPHDIDHILDNKIGDCKDHTALLQALLAAKGIASSPALVNSGSVYSMPEIPVAGMFDHVINYIPELNMYADSTSDTAPFGTLPPSEEGKPVLHTTDFKEISHTPPTDNSKHWGKTAVDITFHEDGSADATLKSTVAGMNALSARGFFKRVEMTKFKNDIVKAAISAAGLNGTGEYIHYDKPDGKDDPFTYEVKYHITNALSLPGPVGAVISPFIAYHNLPLSNFISTIGRDRPLHNFPCMGGSATIDVTMHTSKGITIIATPKDVHLKSPHSTYDSVYTRTGDTITSHRELIDNTPPNVCTPEVFDSFKEIDLGVAKDLKAQVIFQ